VSPMAALIAGREMSSIARISFFDCELFVVALFSLVETPSYFNRKYLCVDCRHHHADIE